MRRTITSVYAWKLDYGKTVKEVGRGESKACLHFGYSFSFLVTFFSYVLASRKENLSIFIFVGE